MKESYRAKECCHNTKETVVASFWSEFIDERFMFSNLPTNFQGRYVQQGANGEFDCSQYFDFTNTSMKYNYYLNGSNNILHTYSSDEFVWNAIERKLIIKQIFTSHENVMPSWYCKWYADSFDCEGDDPMTRCMTRTWTINFSRYGSQFAYLKEYGMCDDSKLERGQEVMRQDMWNPDWWWIFKTFDDGKRTKGISEAFDTYELYSNTVGEIMSMYFEKRNGDLKFAYNLVMMNPENHRYARCAESGTTCTQCPNHA